MDKQVKVFDFDVKIFTNDTFQEAMEIFCLEGKMRSVLFLSIPILEEIMVSEEYKNKISKFQVLLPGEENVLLMHPLEEFRQQSVIMDEQWLCRILKCIEQEGKSLYLVGDYVDKLECFLAFCEEYYPNLNIVGSFVGADRMDEGCLLNDINTACPDVILTALAPQFQENWIISNVDKLNGTVCIGADILVTQIVNKYKEEMEQESSNMLYYRFCKFKKNIVNNCQKRIFRMDYEHYMKQREERTKEKG